MPSKTASLARRRRPARLSVVSLGRAFGALFLAPVALPAAESVRPLVMQLDWIHNAQFAGLYQAVAQGYYAAAGLEVEIRPSDKAQSTVAAVVEAPLAFGSAESNVLLAAHAGGAPVKALATMFQGSPMGWMYLPQSGIEEIGDLAGKRIGIHPDGEKVIALVASRQGFSTEASKLPHVGYSIDPLVKGEIDAMQAYSIDEYVTLRLAKGDEARILLARDHGYEAYSQVIFTTAETVEAEPALVRAFLAATREGWIYALAHPSETVDLILAEYNPSLDRAQQIASLSEIAKLVLPPGSHVLAPMDPTVWSSSQEDFLRFGLVPARTDIEELLDLRFNP
ncbi:MAG: ABC transporter substrate-binding protein [Verrucomicrobiota bacterium]